MSAFAVTPIYVAFGALILMVLSGMVIRQRRARRIGLGDGGNAELLTAMRMHGNAVETLPIQLLLLAMVEAVGAATPLLHAFGVAIILSRLLHAFGLAGSSGISFGRFWGTVISLLLMIGMPLYLLWRSLLG